KRLDAAIVRAHQQVIGIARRFMHPHHLHDDEAGAAFGARDVIGDERLGRQVILGQIGVMPGREYPVAELGRLDLIGGEEMREELGHGQAFKQKGSACGRVAAAASYPLSKRITSSPMKAARIYSRKPFFTASLRDGSLAGSIMQTLRPGRCASS